MGAASLIARHEVALLVLAAPFLVFPGRWTGPAFGLIVVTWLGRLMYRRCLTVRTPLDAPIVFLLLMTIVGMFASVALSVSWPHFWGTVLGVAIYYGLVNGLHSQRDIQRMGVVLLGFGTAAALLSMPVTDWQNLQYYDLSWVSARIPTLNALAQALPAGGPPRGDIGLFHPRPIGGAMGLLFPVALSLLLFGHGRVVRGMAAFAALVMGFTLVLAQALSALAGTVVAVLVLALWRYRWLRWVVPPTVILSMVLGQDFLLSALDADNRLGGGLVERFALWLWGLEALRHQPLTGVGLNSFGYTLGSLYPMALFPAPNHAHNLLLQVALDLGVPGLLAFLWLLLALGYSVKVGLNHSSDTNTRSLLVGVGAGVVSYMVFGLADSPMLGTKPGAAFWALLGLVGAFCALSDQTPTAHFAVPLKKLAAVTALLAGVVLATLFVPGLRGIAYLNLGTVQAHKALTEARSEGRVPEQLMRSAIGNLEKALVDGQSSVHIYELLGSINGWLGDCTQSVDYMRKSVMSGGEQALGSQLLAKEPSPLSETSVTFVPRTVRNFGAAFLRNLKSRLGLPRTADTQQVRYDYMLRVHGIRSGPSSSSWEPSWEPSSSPWEPYLKLAIIANEEQHDLKYAAQILQSGLKQASFKAPLGCYTLETGNER